MNPLLTLTNVSITYPHSSFRAVEKVSFSLMPKTITALIGPNGSGKSTLIKGILGLIPHTGSVRFSSQNKGQRSIPVGYVPQRFSFDTTFPITLSEFLHLICEDTQSVKASLAEVQLLDKEHSLLSTLSGGQLQRVLLARAIVNNPQLLILDEPEAGIDVASEMSFYGLLDHLVKEHDMTILIATHDLDIVSTLATNALCINKTLVCSGPPQKILTESMFKHLYGHELQFYGHHHT